ncbi:MAG: RNase adapter RapZ [Acidimicrobiia bacterium]|nr:RNase adapter RapZ [Acidimicrobiia bacterium]MDH3397419.1 RNase adapter RapZ [Acidimicrobiia bacterium]
MVSRPQVLVVTGMSGAGRSTAAKVLEDLGYLVVDNLPPALIGEIVRFNDLADVPRRLALVIDARGGFSLADLSAEMDRLLRGGVSTSLLFLDADDDMLIRRYKENRRPHPMARPTLGESIFAERELLAELRAEADFIIDTTDLNVHQLRERIEEDFQGGQPERPMRVSVSSFGFKHGAPRDADLVFDVRFLPNPHWQEELRPLTGSDAPVRDYVLENDDTQAFLGKIEDMLSFLIPRFRRVGKLYLSIGIGCTGGRHRSVAIAEELGRWLESEEIEATVRHRDSAK